jgi:hypothetical protein
MTSADRWFYFPMLGFLGMIGTVISDNSFQKIHKKVYVDTIFITIISILAVVTFINNTNWYSDIALYSHAAKISDNYVIENNLGNSYASIYDYPDALTH